MLSYFKQVQIICHFPVQRQPRQPSQHARALPSWKCTAGQRQLPRKAVAQGTEAGGQWPMATGHSFWPAGVHLVLLHCHTLSYTSGVSTQQSEPWALSTKGCGTMPEDANLHHQIALDGCKNCVSCVVMSIAGHDTPLLLWPGSNCLQASALIALAQRLTVEATKTQRDKWPVACC